LFKLWAEQPLLSLKFKVDEKYNMDEKNTMMVNVNKKLISILILIFYKSIGK